MKRSKKSEIDEQLCRSNFTYCGRLIITSYYRKTNAV